MQILQNFFCYIKDQSLISNCAYQKIWILPYFFIFLAVFVGGLAGFGVTAGAHRFWCHRSYKAKLPLQILLAIAFSASGQVGE